MVREFSYTCAQNIDLPWRAPKGRGAIQRLDLWMATALRASP
jgi:hypothetical protein